MKDIPTKYSPAEVEGGIYKLWEKNGLNRARPDSGKPSYSIVIPPPNVTGILHMGHALNNTIQDILIRWKRMQGHETLWMPGTDHAGIATQNVVERKLAGEGLKRTDLGRDKFLEEVWKWKEEHGSTIIRQLKSLGCSCDWDRTRFTMDEGLSNAVRKVFVKLYEDGLLYKGDYIINWCPRCTTALSDEEAEHREVLGMLYYIKYPVKGREKLEKANEDFVVVATTRPETMLGDVAVAVSPKDPRYRHLEGKKLLLPILGRELDVIFDESVDPEFGTGALKVTPAHDPVDFEMGSRHGLERLNVMGPDAAINDLGGDYEGMDRFECREAIIEDLKQRKLFVRAEEHHHAVGHCYRCHTVVEPRLSKQWFVRMKPLAGEAIKVVKEDRVRFYPPRWSKVYLNWMENIRDWCISRQIWWGHRIPVWYCRDCFGSADVRDIAVDAPGKAGIVVGEAPSECPVCGSASMEQDPDVLDTWFSSWLWPFSTMGWPEKTGELEYFYPTDALVTAQEIIFFWVARMIMSGLYFMGDIPFRDVYIHGTVRDATGTKMSKSLGNVIDPMDVIREVGSDALRYSIISITSQGQDVFLSKEKFETGRNFANKLWNASRYVLMSSGEKARGELPGENALTIADKWILSSLAGTVGAVNESLEAYRFNDAASSLYEFIWHKYCDWYLEISKFAENREAVDNILVLVLGECLKLLHPFMPFITENIWQNMPGKDRGCLMTAGWPEPLRGLADDGSVPSMEKIIGLITSIRNVKAFWNIPNSGEVEALFLTDTEEEAVLIGDNRIYLEKLAGCRVLEAGTATERPSRSVSALSGKIRIFVPLGGSIDIDKEKDRIGKKLGEMENYLKSIEKKLSNRSFVSKAPAEVVEKEKAKKDKFEISIRNLKENLASLE
ncbi:MAG: valine--tRNA ligase [Candidatus Omnitrophica bacterium]|nr:valine--tRNA ligase [Candidatus Omnitrophota bacterium]